MSTIDVLNAEGAIVPVELPLVPGRAPATTSRPVALSNEDKATLDLVHTDLASANTALAAIQTATASNATAANQATALTNFGAVADAAWSGTGSGTLIAIQKYLGSKLEAVRALLAGTLNVAVFSGSTAIGNTAGALNVAVVSGGGGGGGASLADEAAFVAGTTAFTPIGGFFQTTATANPLTNGQAGFAQLTAQRAVFANLRSSTGVEITNTSGHLDVNIASGVPPVGGGQTLANSSPVDLPIDMRPARVAQDTNTVLNGNVALQPKYAKIAATASGTTTVVAAVASKKIRVLCSKVTVSGAADYNLQSHTTTATATGLTHCAAAGDGDVLPYSPVGWFETVAGEALDINLSAAVNAGGQITYVEV